MERLSDREALASWRNSIPVRESVGFVPTMGALHAGHEALVRRCRSECACSVVSIFLNPMQFDQPEDLRRYPRDLEGDCRLLERLGVSAVYLPAEADLYPPGFDTRIRPGEAGEGFEGRFRPGHFEGVLTVVCKLFQRVRPQRAYFGEKDAQQLFLVRRMTLDLDLPVRIVACPTVREEDGLALSSRNRRLDPEARRRAAVLPQACRAAREACGRGEHSPRRLEAAMLAVFREAGVEPEYAAVVDDDRFLPAAEEGAGPLRAVAAATIGGVRLID
ncbi:MAG: pantoate--beta-alanine ligase, partial [Planctomycetota bacterium]